jgi:hypothetical protein
MSGNCASYGQCLDKPYTYSCSTGFRWALS